MNWLRNTVAPVSCSLAVMVALFLACGCDSLNSSPPASGGPTHAAAAQPSPAAHAVTPAPAGNVSPDSPDLLRPGDAVLITFSGVERPPERFDGRIRDDGKVILPFLTTPVQAAGKTAAQLQDQVHDLYVPAYFNRLTVNVNTEGRYFFVQGEVKSADRYVYNGQISVLKAIAAARDFTDFAKRTKVQIIRVNGKIDVVNCNKAKRNPKLDLPIFPGDIIFVPRRIF